jgi:Cu(I)/Ag(I) efflux system membrane fusion protein
LDLRFATIIEEEIHPSLQVPGRLITDERRTVRLSPKVDGWIRRLAVSGVGEAVHKGQVLFEMYSPELQQRQRDYLAVLTQRDALLAAQRGMGATPEGASPDAMLASVARERYRLRSQLAAADVPEAVLDDLERTRRVHDIIPVLAEHEGVVTEVDAREAAFVTPAQTVLGYTDLSAVWAELWLQPDQLDGLRRGAAVALRSTIEPGPAVHVRIAAPLAVVDPATGVARLRVPVPVGSRGFLPGTLVDARMELPGHTALTIDADAVIYTGHGDFLIGAGTAAGTFELLPVQTGLRSGSRVEVFGLAAGRRVVTHGQFLLSAEASLQHIGQAGG